MSPYGDAEIYVYPAELWSYITEHRDFVESHIVVIAEDFDTGIEVALETDLSSRLMLSVMRDGKEEESKRITAKEDAMTTCRDYYARYFKPAQDTQDADEEDDDYLQMEIDQREGILCSALEDFVDLAADQSCDFTLSEDDMQMMLDDVLTIIADYGVPVYRPFFIECEDGTTEFVEYPYNTAEETADNNETTPDDRVEI